MKFHDFIMKNGKRTPSRARTPTTSPNHCNYKQIHRSRRGAIRPEIAKTTWNHFSPLFGNFPPGIMQMHKFINFRVNLAKTGSLGGPAPRSLFFLRIIKVFEPPEYGKLLRNGEFHEIPWKFMKFHDFSWIPCNFHVFRGFPPIFVFWGVWGPPGRFENLDIPIGISRFSACGSQGTPKILQNVILAPFCWFSRNSAENWEVLVNLRELMVFVGF